MKNVRGNWTIRREPGIPSSDCWGSREWRRYQERQARKAKKRSSGDFGPYQSNESITYTLAFNLVGLGIAAALLSFIVGWPIALLIIALAFVVCIAGGD